MEKFNAKKRVSKKLRSAIENVIKTNEQYSGCYFWNNTGSAGQRRSTEKKFFRDNPFLSIVTAKDKIEVKPYLSISCKNFYYSLEITRNGKKSNIKILKNMI